MLPCLPHLRHLPACLPQVYGALFVPLVTFGMPLLGLRRPGRGAQVSGAGHRPQAAVTGAQAAWGPWLGLGMACCMRVACSGYSAPFGLVACLPVMFCAARRLMRAA